MYDKPKPEYSVTMIIEDAAGDKLTYEFPRSKINRFNADEVKAYTELYPMLDRAHVVLEMDVLPDTSGHMYTIKNLTYEYQKEPTPIYDELAGGL